MKNPVGNVQSGVIQKFRKFGIDLNKDMFFFCPIRTCTICSEDSNELSKLSSDNEIIWLASNVDELGDNILVPGCSEHGIPLDGASNDSKERFIFDVEGENIEEVDIPLW
jgi:hypothetical protein